MHLACEKGHLEVIKVLLSSGANIHENSNASALKIEKPYCHEHYFLIRMDGHLCLWLVKKAK